MIDTLIERAEQGGPEAMLEALDEYLHKVLASAGLGNKNLVYEAEEGVEKSMGSAFEWDEEGHATLRVGERSYAAGRFETPSLAELYNALGHPQSRHRRGSPRLFVLEGVSPATDIGALQAFAPPDTLFQVASQFNCLEAPDACLVKVQAYLRDPTQGPRAAVSCFPGALLRHYAAPREDGARFIQQEDGEQIQLLGALCPEGVARVENGYLMDQNIADPVEFLRLLDNQFEHIRVGLHRGLEVVLGYAWEGGVPGAPHTRIAQAFTSTLAGGGYSEGRLNREWTHAICLRLQRAAQLGTLLGAAHCGAKRAVLTLIGGGVFANPLPLIWESILWAVDELERLGIELDIVVNGRNLGLHLPWQTLLSDTEARGGVAIHVGKRERV